MIERCPISATDQSRLFQFGKKRVFAGIFTVHVVLRERSRKGDAPVADVELENFGRVRKPCSETQCQGSHARGEDFVLPFANWSSLQEDQVFSGHPLEFRITVHEERSTTMSLEKKRTGLNHQTDKRMTPKLEVISGGCLGTIFIVITFNQEVSSTCQMKSHSLHTRNIPHACILEKTQIRGKEHREDSKKRS